MNEYDHQKIEEKWQKYWEDNNCHKTDLKAKKPYYCLDMFPYPSGTGLHVGHWSGYVYSDVWSRYMKLKGFQVLHPMGWDAFGLPAENAAIKATAHPRDYTEKAIKNFTKQLKEIGAIYDWDLEINSSAPEYYKWTQWLFVQLFKNGLAYQKQALANYCPSCQTVLANEQVVDGACERCGEQVTQKKIKQWFFKITDFADQLLEDLDDLDWQERVKKMQRNWIGKSRGTEIDFTVKGARDSITVYTTRIDTLFGATFMVLAPEHPLVAKVTTAKQKNTVEKYLEQSNKQTIRERKIKDDKTGVFTGSYAINPVNGQKVAIWVADYVLMEYGTGAVMAVPAHDQRDFEFANKFDIPVIEVISSDGKEHKLTEAYEGEGELINSSNFTGQTSSNARKTITEFLANDGQARFKTNYKLNDWLISRQRYWGAPIPIIHCASCGAVPIPEKDLPVKLPELDNFKPAKDGKSPLAKVKDFVNVKCPKCGKDAERETDTMDTFVDSSWYFLRYPSANIKNKAFDEKLTKHWLPVDQYVGGIEHAVLHLLYARFITKALYKLKKISFNEPFKALFNQGMIYRKGKKMSKSLGNIVSPDDLVKQFGRDSVRGYELFIGPPDQDKEWADDGIQGVFRFLNKTYQLFNKVADKTETKYKKQQALLNNSAKAITDDLERFHLNTIVSHLMKLVNSLEKQEKIDYQAAKSLIILLAPIFPHLAEELWKNIGEKPSVFNSSWPKLAKIKASSTNRSVVVQINGKKRGIIKTSDTNQGKVVEIVKTDSRVADLIKDKQVIKEIAVGKPITLVNLVVK